MFGSTRGSEKPVFKKKAQHTGFFGFIWLQLYWVFQIFHLHEQLGSLLVDLAHQLSFYLDKIRKFITYWSLEDATIKKSLCGCLAGFLLGV